MTSLIHFNGHAHALQGLPPGFEHSVRPLSRSPIQRILLVTDGTVTEILEAFTGESMRLIKLHETVDNLEEALPGLGLGQGERVLRRQILLQGKMTLTNYTYADSYIAVDRLDEALRRALLESHKPIGFLIQEQR